MAGRRGQMNDAAKLTEEQVLHIRRLAKEQDRFGRWRYSSPYIAKQYEAMGVAVSVETIRRVIRRETWAHLPDEEVVAEEVANVVIPPSVKMQIEASAARLFKLQEDMKADKLLDELEGKGEGG